MHPAEALRAILLASVAVLLGGCAAEVVGPVAGIEVTVAGPATVVGKRYDQYGTVYCLPQLEAIAKGPAGAEAEWTTLIVYRGESGNWSTFGQEATGNVLLDLWGSSRIRAGETLKSQYAGFLIGAPPLTSRYVFHYRDLATGEILRAQYELTCAAAAP